jgi:hypothetical protein
MSTCARTFITAWVGVSFAQLALQGGTIHYHPAPQLHQETTIKSVTPSAITVTTRTLDDRDKLVQEQTRAFIITRFTEITVNGVRATLADLRPGMKVNVAMSTDPTKAARILANG